MSATATYMQARETMPRMTDTLKTHGESIDAYLGDMARRTLSGETRRQYDWILRHLADDADRVHKRYVNELTLDDYERTLNRWTGLSASTLSQRISCFRGYSRFVWKKGWSEQWLCADMERPRRPRAEDLDVVSVSTEDVLKMFAATADRQELICLATAAYLGARRAALASVRRRDVDLVAGTIRFHEKGGKVIVKPLPDEYRDLLLSLEQDGLWPSPDSYLIPNRRPNAVRRKERSDKVVWETVKTVAARAGVKSHVHALRAAFAVAFDAAHPGELFALKELMGHSRIETTLVYLRRKDRAKSMETVRDLRWATASVLSSDAAKAHTGFEPVPPPNGLTGPLQRKLAEVRDRPVARDPRSLA